MEKPPHQAFFVWIVGAETDRDDNPSGDVQIEPRSNGLIESPLLFGSDLVVAAAALLNAGESLPDRSRRKKPDVEGIVDLFFARNPAPYPADDTSERLAPCPRRGVQDFDRFCQRPFPIRLVRGASSTPKRAEITASFI